MYRPYRFELEKYRKGKRICPNCGKRSFAKYIDNEGEITFPDYVGRCDREDKCQYHYPPKQYFSTHNESLDRLRTATPKSGSTLKDKQRNKKVMNENISPSFIDESFVRSSLSHYGINPLHRYLCGVFGKEETDRLFALYNVGTAKMWDGSTVFWQQDKDGKFRTGKIMRYDPKTGHRVKDTEAPVTWAHSVLKIPDFNLVQCLFGEHLLNAYPDSPVTLVESEKTAIICRHFMPDYLWLATGGKNSCFKPENITALQGRDVTLFPDLGAYDKWREKVPALQSVCGSVKVDTTLEEIATDEQREQGLDIADFLLMEDTPHMLLERMIRRNPSLQILVDGLELEPETITAVEESDLKAGEV